MQHKKPDYPTKTVQINHDEIDMKYIRKIVTKEFRPEIKSVDFIIDKSTANNAGNGVFVNEDIPKGTFITSNTSTHIYNISIKINDLAYTTEKKYNFDDVIEKTNVIAVVIGNGSVLYGAQYTLIALMAIKDIKAGDELSRCYGCKYWDEIDFWRLRPECKWRDTRKDEDMPDEYIIIDNISRGLEYNARYNLWGKKVGDKYYYQLIIPDMFNNKVQKIIDISLDDNSIMPDGYDIYYNECMLNRDSYHAKTKRYDYDLKLF